MVNKIGLIIAAGAATAALTVALAAAGFAPGAPTPTASVTTVVQQVPVPAPAVDPTAQPQVVYDNVYVKPAPPPKTVVVKVIKPSAGGQEGGEVENEGSDD
jgi:hypothetical protein